MKPTILLVEDDADARETLRDVLDDEGYETLCASDGETALAQANAAPNLGLVLLDLYMPGMDGLAFFNAFRADHRFDGVPVVVTTSAPDRAPAAATRVLTKPLALDSVLRAAAELCRPS